MGALTRWDPFRDTRLWDPFRDLEEVQQRLSRLFSRPLTPKDGGKEEMTIAEWSPLVDISEDDKEYLVKAELPDIKKEDIKLNVHNDVLSISGERKYEKEEKGKKFHRVERAYGSFLRSFSLPEDADAAKISAECKDGILRVHIPKSEKAKPKSIDVKVG